MARSPVKIAVVKLGCIGTLPLLDIMIDERADREDVEVRAFSSGSKMDTPSCEDVTRTALTYGPDLVLLASPNAALPGPTEARNAFLTAGIPTIALTDGPGQKAFMVRDEHGKKTPVQVKGLGFVVIPQDPMIGARREFLDPTEMVLFNGELLKVLSVTGVIRKLQKVIDGVIEDIKNERTPSLPRLVLRSEEAAAEGGFANPYAASKAIAALKILEALAKVSSEACFKTKDRNK
ncbi:MAG: F420-dependent methylenetetrahydromethanopterin dehydrogenase, partial [Candidatus Thorarchaeota archaeon]